jgi:archaellum component FlaC
MCCVSNFYGGVWDKLLTIIVESTGLAGGRDVQVADLRTKLEEKIRSLEDEKRALLEEVEQLKEVVALSERAKGLESEVDRLRREVKTLKERIPWEFLRELGEVTPQVLGEEEEEKTAEEECSCDEEELL